MRPEKTAPTRPRAQLIADTALALLAERGMRGLTHRAVDEAAGLPPGSTSNHARTRAALLEAAVRRLAEREEEVLAPREMPDPAGPDGLDALADALALALHRSLTGQRELLLARYELALEAARRPELREIYDATGRGRFRAPVIALLTAAGSPEPERHALSLIAWCEGLMFSCAAGSYHAEVPGPAELRRGFRELLRGALGR
ncbi:TetR/AcrR family transcriptional regulator [Streptomyces hesseae]|uniref:TetR family transcriptional regulator n=1 Tax=Streptomyces hesseae TaxID=3075519 RepID=A0ABU2SVR1_9ACTN|nr:TetR family transcriptional regulator [Streptomyces sp. DSM 40473]MDT0452716.1 TetR family transcriptional regulator [Streptomyces sp. DSM 40473]